MTTRNSILLILKQNQGIEFNALLAKISANYGNINSARAAMSRALKDMSAIGLVQKQEKKVFATDKGLALLGNEMKTKLILRLNELVKEDEAAENIDSIVQLLSTLIERSKQDSDLLKAARSNTSFFLADIQKIKERLDTKAKHLDYLGEIMMQQLDSMRQLNFNDSSALAWNHESKKIISGIIEKMPSPEIVAECLNADFLEKAKQSFPNSKTQEKSVFLNREQIAMLLSLAEQSTPLYSNPINIYAGSIKIQLNHPSIFLIGPVQEVEEIKKQVS